jgi:hypothetical protein
MTQGDTSGVVAQQTAVPHQSRVKMALFSYGIKVTQGTRLSYLEAASIGGEGRQRQASLVLDKI